VFKEFGVFYIASKNWSGFDVGIKCTTAANAYVCKMVKDICVARESTRTPRAEKKFWV